MDAESPSFNDSQYRAVSHFKGPALVLAGPGSGKTLVIVHRLKNLIENYGIPPDNILVVTFSKAAAMEMRERFIKLKLPVNAFPDFGTFHSIFFRILKASYNYDSSNIIRESQKYEFLKYETEKFDFEYEDESAFLKKIINEISKVKNSMLSPDNFVPSSIPADSFRSVYAGYANALKSRNLIDFDDMLSMTHSLLLNRPDILKSWQEKYKYILVDEFQDINRIQYETIKLLALPDSNLFVVGDDDQSIYGFRGSSPGIMFSFKKDFPAAEEILLNVNYRSRKLILSKSQQLISVNKDRMDKEVLAFKDNSLNADNHVFTLNEIFSISRFSTQAEQYASIASEIDALRHSGYDLSEVAVLFRNNFDSSVMAQKLSERNIPFSVKEVPQNIFRHFIALDLRSYLGLNEPYADKRPLLLRIINKPLRYISRAALDYDSLSKTPSGSSLQDCFSSMYNYYSSKPYMAARIKALEKHLDFLKGLPPFPAIEYVLKAIGYEEYLEIYAKEKHVDYEGLMAVLDSVKESAKPFTTFREWMQYIKKCSEDLEESNVCNSPAGKPAGVQLMTMHSSKGLEFDTVYIPNVNKETIPIRKALKKEEISEERRLFYVAMTRARDHLKISYVEQVRNRNIAPSEFLDNIL